MIAKIKNLNVLINERQEQVAFIRKLISIDIYAALISCLAAQTYAWITQFSTTPILLFNLFVFLLFSFFSLLLRNNKIFVSAILITIIPSVLVFFMVFFMEATFASIIIIPISINALLFFPDNKLFGRIVASTLFLLACTLWIIELPKLAETLQNQAMVKKMIFNVATFIFITFYKVVSLLWLSQFEYDLQKKSEQKLREFLTYSSEAIFNLEFKKPINLNQSIEGQINDFLAFGYLKESNQAFVDLHAIHPSVDLKGLSIRDLNKKIWPNRGSEFFKSLARSNYQISESKISMTNLRNEQRFISNSIFGIIKGQKLFGLWGIQRDITTATNTEIALQKNESYLSTVLNNLKDCLWTIDKDYKLTGFNKTWISMLQKKGLPAPKIGEDALQYAPQENMPFWTKAYQSALSGENIEHSLSFSMNGTPHYCLLNISPIIHTDQQITGALVYAANISKIKNAEYALRQSEERYRTIFENSRLGICTSNGTQITRVNPAFAEMVGYQMNELVNNSPKLIVEEHLHKRLEDTMSSIKSGEIQSADFELNFIRKDRSTLHGYVKMRGIYDEKGKYKESITTITDITTIKKAQHALEEKNKSLEKYIESNMQLENFAYLASHDLKAPIRTILGFTQILSKQLHDRMVDKERQYLDYIMKGAKGMDELIHSLLEYSKVNSQKINKESIRLYELLDGVLEDLRANIEEADAEIILSSIPKAIFGDHVQIRQLFQNLIANAIKFRKKEEALFVEIKAFEEKKHWRFEVKDNGIGIDESSHHKIFQLFRKLHSPKDYEGTGIGLALCKKIIELHDGEISLKSELGKGTTFIFTIAK